MAMAERLKTPLLFPCAARVKMPQIGSEDSDMNRGHKCQVFVPDAIVFKNPSIDAVPISRNYLRKVSTDLKFEEEVVKERCFHALPYDEKYLYEALDIGNLVTLPARVKFPVGRHNTRGTDKRHMPCNLTKLTKSHLKPLKRKIIKRAQQMHLEAQNRAKLREIQKHIIEKYKQQKQLKFVKENTEDSEEIAEDSEDKIHDTIHESVFLTETKPFEMQVETKTTELPTADDVVAKSASDTDINTDIDLEKVVAMERKTENNWDGYVMSILSANTANWIVYERTPVGSQDRQKLEKLLKTWYGVPEHTDLLREDMSDTEDDIKDLKANKPKKKWKKKEETLLQKVYNLEKEEFHDETKTPFYRQPAGLRRARKHEVKEELGAINTTAANIEVKPFKPPPPPTLRDLMNPQVGQYILDTSNLFQQEQLTGTEQVYDGFGDKTKIVMGSHNKYKKDLQPGYPQSPDHWFPETDAEKLEQVKNRKKRKKFERGLRRWVKLPEPIDDTVELLSLQAPGSDADLQKSADPRTRKTAKNNASLMQIIDEWRMKWHLTGQYVDSTPDDLIKDMADIQPHVRLKAIATCSKASDYRPPDDNGIKLDFMQSNEPKNLPEKLFVALECLLEDPVDKVRTAAAITLYSLNRPSELAQQILYKALQSENTVDRWAAAQCLAHFGVCDSDVISEILHQLLNMEDTIKHERGISMLANLSITSNLVHSMVAEQLNSSSWRHKIIACKILPVLKGDINRDITNKLSDLMWNDWHSEVRRAAAQCLGKTGHGRDVHDDLRRRIMEGDERLKLEALSKVGHLGIMTAKLLPAFLQCFEDEYLSVRSEVCITCANLAIKDEQVIARLIHLATFDNIWKVKALALQALGKIGNISDQVVDCLLWAVRYEENPGVRAEACHTLKVLGVKTEQVADILQDRFLVESNPLVRDELAATLKMFDISATEDMDMVAQIKSEVKKLSQHNIIATQITMNEQDKDRKENLTRMIYESEQEMQEHEKQNVPVMERIRSLSRTSSRKSKATSGYLTPEQAHETAFTPTADQELEEIFTKQDIVSGKTSPADTETQTTPGTKSCATKASSEVPEDELEGLEKSTGKSHSHHMTSREGWLPSSESRSSGEDDLETEVVNVDSERPVSVVKFATTLKVAEVPSRPGSSLGPSRLSGMDEHGRPLATSKTARTTRNEGMVFGREAIVEREKIDEEARNTFAVMDERYQHMVQDLIDLDNAFELGLTFGTREDFENKIQNVQIIKTPPSKGRDQGKIVVTFQENRSSNSSPNGDVLHKPLDQSKTWSEATNLSQPETLGAEKASKISKPQVNEAAKSV